MKNMKRKRANIFLQMGAALGASAAVLAPMGCATTPADMTVPHEALTPDKASKYSKEADVPLKADAGVPVKFNAGDGLGKLKTLVAGHSFSSRPDPFALLAVEKNFDLSQSAERILQLQNGFQTDWTPPAEPPPEVIEPQPYRRLAGVMVGDSVLAMIDMGDGKLQIIHPGELIPGTEWTVASIDSEKAVLRRSGNKKPKEVVVPLGSSLSGVIVQPSGSGSGTGSNRPGAPGAPGAPGGPGGAPGGPGGARAPGGGS